MTTETVPYYACQHVYKTIHKYINCLCENSMKVSFFLHIVELIIKCLLIKQRSLFESTVGPSLILKVFIVNILLMFVSFQND